MFLDKNPDSDDNQGESLGIAISIFLIWYIVSISIVGIIRLTWAIVNPKPEEQNDQDKFSNLSSELPIQEPKDEEAPKNNNNEALKKSQTMKNAEADTPSKSSKNRLPNESVSKQESKR